MEGMMRASDTGSQYKEVIGRPMYDHGCKKMSFTHQSNFTLGYEVNELGYQVITT
jgi:hypothetical protein